MMARNKHWYISWGLLGFMMALPAAPACAQSVFNCSGFATSGTCGVSFIFPLSEPFYVVGAQNNITPSLSGSQVLMAPVGADHTALNLNYAAAAVNVEAFTSTFSFMPDGSNLSFVLQNNTNTNAGGGGPNFSSGAGGEGSIFQGFAALPPSPNKIFAIMLDFFSPLTSSGTFTYSSAQIYQMNQSPALPTGTADIPLWPTNKSSTSPVAMSGSTQNSCLQTAPGTCDTYTATVTYDGSNVTLSIYDVTTGGSCPGVSCFTKTWSNISIPSLVDGTTAYVGLAEGNGVALPYPMLINSFSYTVNTPTATPTFAAYNANATTNNGTASAATPVFSLAPGTYAGPQTVTLTESVSGASLCYLFSSTQPALLPQPDNMGGCLVGTPYTSPIVVTANGTLYATAGLNYAGPPSAVTAATYTITPVQASAPTFSVTPGVYSSTQNVTITGPAGAILCYNTTGNPISNGNANCAAGTQYSGPITVAASETLYATAGGAGYLESPVASAKYVIAPTCAITGTSQSSVAATITGCVSGSWVTFPAGTYGPFTSVTTIPCGVNVSGPFVPYSETPNQTATLNGSSSFAGWGFQTTAGCSAPQTIQYLAWNGELPSNGGGFLNIVAGTTNLTVQNNWLHGVNSPGPGYNNQADLIFMSGSYSAATTSNVTIQWNRFGNTVFADCATAMENTSSAEDNNGGGCGGVGIHANNNNVTVTNNIFQYLEEPIKLFESSGTCTNLNVNYNALSEASRISYETQCGYPNTPNQQNILFNSWGSRYSTNVQSYVVSAANGCATAPNLTASCWTHTDNNVFVETTSCCDTGIEVWGSSATNPINTTQPYTSASGNLIQGYMYNGINWSSTGNFLFNNNTFNITVGNNSFENCSDGTQSNGYWKHETQNPNSYVPSCSGNTYSNATSGTYASAAPAISPASQSFPATQLVTLTNTGVGRDTNTSIWYTTDGSTPVPGSGTATLYTTPFYVNRTTTVNAVGMWGAANQPYSYPANYGYVPSPVTTATYTLASGPVTLQSVTVAATGGANGMQVGNTLQMIATCGYSDGSTTGCNSVDAHGNQVTGWTSSSPAVTITAGGVAAGASIGSANIQATVTGGLQSNVYGLTVSAAPNTLHSVALSTAGNVTSIQAGTTNQLSATCTYTNGTQTNCGSAADSYGNMVGAWSSSAPTIATANTAGLVSGVAAGSANLSASVTPQPAQLGANVYSFSNTTHNGYLNYTYAVTGSAASGYTPQSCFIYLPAQSIAAGTEWDCLLLAAPSPTTQPANALCSNRYTFSSATSWGAGFLTIPMGSCPALSPDTPYWVASVQNQATASRGVWSCSSSTTTGNCGSTVPTLGSGTYGYCYYAGTFGSYTSLSPTLTCGLTSQVTQYVTVTATPVTSSNLTLNVTAAPPTLASAYLSASSGSVTVGNTLQFAARCVYTNPSTTTDCTVADIYGNAVSAWASSDTTKATIGAVGSSTSGLLTGVAAGSSNVTAVINGGITSTAYPVTVIAPLVALTGVSLATSNGVTGLFVGSTNHLIATCVYADGSTTNCTSTDSHGNVAGSYVSTNPSAATVNATTGLVTAVAAGITTFTATAGATSSPALPLTVLPMPSGVYSIVITGPVGFAGTVKF